jgi:DUF971 family protein
MNDRPKPTEIRLKKQEKALEVDFDDGTRFRFPAEFLRVHSPSAEVRGHGPGQETLVSGRRHVGILNVAPVGRYAIGIQFDDLHDTGIYSWEYLHELGRNQDSLWRQYLERLEKSGASREP